MSDNKIKKLLKQYGVEKRTKDELYEIKEEKIKKVQLVEQKKQEKTELLLLAEKATELRESEERQRVLDEEFERREKISSAQYKLTNPFSIGRKFNTDIVRQAAIDNILPKAFIPEQTSYPEPFEEEPALNRELSEFKRKINEHMRKMGFAGGSGGGAGIVGDLDDVDISGRGHKSILMFNNVTKKYEVADPDLDAGISNEDDSGDEIILNATTTSGSDESASIQQENSTRMAAVSSVTLTGSTATTITTITGANAAQGEANLTFDGSTLTVTGDVTASGAVTCTPTAILLIKNSSGTTLKTINGVDAN